MILHLGKELINIAPGKPTDQDSVRYGGNPGHAIDGSRSGIYNQYVFIDLLRTFFNKNTNFHLVRKCTMPLH